MKSYYVYIATNNTGTLYIGVTNDLERRSIEHKLGASKFTLKYGIKYLVYYEEAPDIRAAIAREKQLKGWRRDKKLALIQKQNPGWQDLGIDASTGLPRTRYGAQHDR